MYVKKHGHRRRCPRGGARGIGHTGDNITEERAFLNVEVTQIDGAYTIVYKLDQQLTLIQNLQFLLIMCHMTQRTANEPVVKTIRRPRLAHAQDHSS